MNELFARIKQEKWYMQLTYQPDYYFCHIWDDGFKHMGHGCSCIAPESAIIDAIREMDSK